MNTTQNIKCLNRQIVRKYTAFSTELEMRQAMVRGYVPTVSRKRQRPLLDALKSNGMPVFEVP